MSILRRKHVLADEHGRDDQPSLRGVTGLDARLREPSPSSASPETDPHVADVSISPPSCTRTSPPRHRWLGPRGSRDSPAAQVHEDQLNFRGRRRTRPPAFASRPAAQGPPSRSRLVHRHADDVVRLGREIEPAPHVADVQRLAVRRDRREHVPLELLVEPLGRHLVGDRQQDRQRQLRRARAALAPTPDPSVSDSGPPTRPPSRASVPSRRARSRPGTRATATKSLRSAVPRSA